MEHYNNMPVGQCTSEWRKVFLQLWYSKPNEACYDVVICTSDALQKRLYRILTLVTTFSHTLTYIVDYTVTFTSLQERHIVTQWL